MLTYFQNSFTVRLCSKFVIKPYLTIRPHLKHVATLPCEIYISKNHHFQAVIETNFHLDLATQKTVFKYLSRKISII